MRVIELEFHDYGGMFAKSSTYDRIVVPNRLFAWIYCKLRGLKDYDYSIYKVKFRII